MCTTCGCASGEKTIEGDEHHHHDDHHHHDHHDAHHHHPDHHHHHDGEHQAPAGVVIHHHHHYYHQGDVHHHYAGVAAAESFTPEVQPHSQDLHYGHGEAGSHAPGIGQRRLVQIEQDVLSKNNHLAAHNREHFSAQHILVLNLVSSPGSGKTTLLTATLERLAGKLPCAVIEGDQQTSNDAERIRATGVPAIQVNTGKGCHLDAQMVHDAAHRLDLQDHSLLFIENVGNLVCPASFDLGERHKVAVLSVTEGEDKPLKYPHMFAAATLMIINKIDLLPYVNFSVEKCIEFARQVNPSIQVIALSATSGEGMDLWLNWLGEQ
ncbi:hydrogenase nickel incorporation protein HypB [Serratia fonticola]|uniref:Hydrogenase maturation factor HypB n=1 Tax=Serratia fonticola TaxID=47917 RepID=A0AAW3WV22_SERFO|nr:hydrogenase nickel incorporation protein HypB [Serratia fonticola]MBC3213462.1 hydrogenase nickel incorporation protein HypB [Serratia fonticola]NYA14321.1 hydrogenase nickel incorporation protein HypB [Serratia fonticola]NYA33963.1 hydrogenase nickel incorporation protein HypB [Serratia fonticola]